MSTMTLDHGPTTRQAHSVRATLRWLRETPTPEWTDARGAKARMVRWVGTHMVVWTGVGIGGALLITRALEAIPTVLS